MREDKENPSFVDSLAGDTKQGSDDAAALPGRLDRYSKAHHRALDMADYINTEIKDKRFSHLPTLLKSCGNYLLFRDYFRIGKVRLHSMRSCRLHLICPFCAIRRGTKVMKTYLDRLQVILNGSPGLRVFHVVFTIKNGEDLGERFKHLQSSLQAYHAQRRESIKGRRSPVEANKASGAFWSYEFKRGEGSGLWHPHLHAIWLCEETPDEKQLKKEWEAVTGDSFNVHIREVSGDPVPAFLEVFKYAVKFSDMPLSQNWEGYQELKGKRLISSFGSFRGVDVPDDLNDDNVDLFDEPFIELLYRFARGAGYAIETVSKVQQAPERVFDGAPRSNLLNQLSHDLQTAHRQKADHLKRKEKLNHETESYQSLVHSEF